MFNKFVTYLLAILIPISFGLLPAQAAVKAGSTCPKAGMTSTSAGKNYTCIKSGKKLVWSSRTDESNGVKMSSSPKPQPETTPTYSDAGQFAPINTCKLKSQVDSNSGESLGLPRPSIAIPTMGTHKTLVFFVDFPDVPFQPKQISEWKQNQIPTFQKYINGMSYGKLEYKVDVNESVFHITKSSLSYNLDTPHDAPRKPNADMNGLVRDSIAAADSAIDFSQYEFFNVVMPSTTNIGTEGTTGMDPNSLIDGKSFTRLTIGPIREYVDKPLEKIWFLHESGHIMGLMHAFKSGPDMPIWGAMSSGISSEPEFVAWERFILGWISDSQNPCIDASKPQKYTVQVVPLSSTTDAIKMVTIKLDDHRVLVAEYRTANPLSNISKEQAGVFVYTVDLKLPGNEGAMKGIFTGPHKNSMQLGTLVNGEQVSIDNVTVKVLGNYSDRSDLEISIK